MTMKQNCIRKSLNKEIKSLKLSITLALLRFKVWYRLVYFGKFRMYELAVENTNHFMILKSFLILRIHGMICISHSIHVSTQIMQGCGA